MQEGPVKPATIYVTDSSTGQNGDESLKAQEECCQEYSTTQGLEVQAVYRDPNGSRVSFEQMITAATSTERPFDYIIVSENSRFSRDAKETADSKKRLLQHQVKVISVKQPED